MGQKFTNIGLQTNAAPMNCCSSRMYEYLKIPTNRLSAYEDMLTALYQDANILASPNDSKGSLHNAVRPVWRRSCSLFAAVRALSKAAMVTITSRSKRNFTSSEYFCLKRQAYGRRAQCYKNLEATSKSSQNGNIKQIPSRWSMNFQAPAYKI